MWTYSNRVLITAYVQANIAFPNLTILLVHAPEKNVVTSVRLQIPSLYIDVHVESVGVTTIGAMDVPQSIENVTWFNLGAVPGEIGSAVIGGHYGWKDQKVSVFDNLKQIQIGNLMHVTLANGTVVTFKVQEIKTYVWITDARDIFISDDGRSHLS